MLTLQTKRTTLTPLKEDDFEAIIQMYFEADSNKFVPPLQNKSIAEYQALLQKKILHNNHPKGHGVWAIRLKDTQEFIGTANLNIQEVLELTHLGVHLTRATWGKGYATETLKALKDYALEILELPEVYALVDAQNLASKNMLAKIGMSYIEIVELYGLRIELYKLKAF